jgi:hypothetical protein
MSVDELVRRVLDGGIPQGAIAVASIPASAVSDRFAPGVVHSCPQLCPTWILSSGPRQVSVVVSEQAPPVPTSILGVQAFIVVDGGAIRALGPTATWPTGSPLDGAAVIPVADGLSAVSGLLRVGPPLLCPQRPAPLQTGILGQPLSWSQCPGTWILPLEGPDPWAGPPDASQAPGESGSIAIGDLSVPDGTLHVQDGAQHAGLDAQGGVWLVRSAVTNACPPWARCPVTNPDIPQPGITWYELVGPIVPPAPTTPVPEPSASPSASASAFILSRERLVADVASGALEPGSFVVADVTIAPVLLSSFPPAPDATVGKIGPLTVHWVSSVGIDSPTTRPIALRVRADGGLDYLGPALLDTADRPFASSSVPTGDGLMLVHGWFYRPTFDLECMQPFGPGAAFRAFDDGKQVLVCDPAFVFPTPKEPVLVKGGTRLVEIPTGALSVQIRDLPRGGPTEGLFLVRHIGCLWSDVDVCPATPGPVWELVGPVAPGT